MKVLIKIILTILIIFFGGILLTIIAKSMGNRVSTNGIGPFIVIPALIASIWAIWRNNDDKNSDDKNQPTLNKN